VLVLRHKKSAAVQQRFASVYGSKKATDTLAWWAVAFLMLSFLTGGLYDTDHGHNDADNLKR